MIRVLHIDTGKAWRGGQAQTLNLAKGLKVRGLDSKIVCRTDSPLYRKAIEENVFPYGLKIKGEYDLIATLKLAKIYSIESPHIVHFHDSHSITIGKLAACFKKVPIKIISRRVDFPIKKTLFKRFKYINGIDTIITVSKGIKEVLLKDGIKENIIHTIYSGIDLNKFKLEGDKNYWREKLEFKKNYFLIGNIASLSDHKGHKYLLQAAKILKERIDNFEILIAGDGKLRNSLINLSKNLKVDDVVKFLGFIEHIPRFLKSIDLFVLSSYLEGLCTSLLDAMASSIPIIATNTGGIPEAVEDGVNGILVTPKDPQALADAIYLLYKNPERMKQMGKKGLNRAEKLFSLDSMIEKTLDLYKMIMNKKELLSK
ncbi:MAG: glycosyltransferase family 4 protein [Acidobacteriota bacterium]